MLTHPTHPTKSALKHEAAVAVFVLTTKLKVKFIACDFVDVSTNGIGICIASGIVGICRQFG